MKNNMINTIRLSRRTLTLGLGSGLLFSGYALNSVAAVRESTRSSPTSPLKNAYASAVTDRNNQHWLVSLAADGQLRHKLGLPSRAHQIAVHPSLPVVAVAARRPGTYLMIVNTQSGELAHELQPEQGHHFYGHACYSPDGRRLYTSENHIDSGEGRIFVRDAQENYQIIQSFSSHGIGPHELKIHPDGQTLVVANGGILTHPDTGRDKLNLDTMSPSLVYLSAQSGDLLEQCTLPESLHQLSIRHIDINQDGLCAIAMQYQGIGSDNVPLIARHERGKAIETLWAPEALNPLMKNYCGSVCFNNSGTLFAVSAPRGNLVSLWDAQDGTFIKHFHCLDVCGISQFGPHGFMFSNGMGKLYQLDTNTKLLALESSQEYPFAWDNHLSYLG